VSLVDTHAHLHFPQYADDLDRVLERARAAGVTTAITIGTDGSTNQAAVALAQRLSGVYATVGIHPHDAAAATLADWAELERLAGAARVVALGEMGLDFFKEFSPRDAQAAAFRRQLDLARRLRKPVVIHCRDAHAETLAILADAGVREVGGVMHCFSGDVDVARRCLDLGLHISFAGPVTYRNARALHEAARFVPGDRLVLETDCPFLPPHPYRGQRNEPAWIALTLGRVAELRGEEPARLAASTTACARRLFAITDSPPTASEVP
jgi:TatD DNase family protein